jgi:ATP-dependent helicase/nuclease subunit A
MPVWTPEQRRAIDADNQSLLVSAAAGSGKTAVMVERILRLLREGGRIDRMVIVTFTKAAAGELRDRLYKNLSEAARNGDRHLQEQLERLPLAQIGTIHSFCGNVVKNYFHVIGIDPAAIQMDDANREILFSHAMEQAMDELTEEPTAGYAALTAAFTDDEIQGMFVTLYQFMMSLSEPFEWLREKTEARYTEQNLRTHPFTQTLVNHCRVCLCGLDAEADAYAGSMADPCADAKWQPVVRSDLHMYARLKEAEDLDELNAAFGVGFMRAPSVKGEGANKQWHETMKARRERLKKGLVKARGLLPGDLARDARDMNAMGPHLEGLRDLAVRFHDIFLQMKQTENALDFNDLIHFTHQVLRDPDARSAIQNSYDHVFVDEYQDVGDAEEGIFRAIHCKNNHLFMVGDVKQSIYRFRLCDPTLFLGKQETFSREPGASERMIFLNRNFRSTPALLETVNRVFETLMIKSVTEIDYDDTARLYPGRSDGRGLPAELYIVPAGGISAPDPEETEPGDGEFIMAAELIQRQITQSSDRPKKERISYRDIVLLLPRVKNIAFRLTEILKRYGIPVYADTDETYFDLLEIRQMLAALNTIDNPRQDLYFLTTLKLPLFNFSDEDLADVRLGCPDRSVSYYEAFLHCAKAENELGAKCRETLERLDLWRFRAVRADLHALLWDLMRECGLYYTAGAQKGGPVRQANLRLLCEYAARYQKVGHGGLSGFLRLSGQLGDRGETRAAKELSPQDNLVRVMTIHKSKGLQFPVVILLGLGGSLHMSETRKLRPHKVLGVGIPYINAQMRVTRKTLAQRAISAMNELEDKAERARLLYVAMTRASEKLMMIGAVNKLPREQFSLSGVYGVYAAKTYLDWLMIVPGCHETLSGCLSTDYPQDGKPYYISICEKSELEAVDKTDSLSSVLSTIHVPVEPEAAAQMAARLTPVERVHLPGKTSVSGFVKNAAFALTEESVSTKASGDAYVPALSVADLSDTPAFLRPAGLSAAQIGSAVHMALSKADFSAAIAPQLDGMARLGFLTAAERAAIPDGWLSAFAGCDICRRMLGSATVRREWSFVMKYYPDRNMLLQGVIDLAFIEDDEWVVCDYKTDKASDAQTLLSRYAKQVHLYREALKRITGKSVREAWLFALRTGESIPVP